MNRTSYSSNNISLNDWYDYFKNLYEQCADTGTSDQSFSQSVNEVLQNFDVSVTETQDAENLNRPISEQEILSSLKKLKCSKSPGYDGIPSEFFKFSSAVITPFLHVLFNFIFESGYFPEDWAIGVIVPLFKKGDRNNVNNYRGISLLNIFGKIFTSILNERLTIWAENNDIRADCQAGFRKNHSTVDNIFVLHAVIQKYLSVKGGKFYCLFVDFSKAFDRVDHSFLLYKLASLGISGKMFQILRSMYSNVNSCVKSNSRMSKYFECPVGVRQGCMLSPILFTFFIEELNNMLVNSDGMGIQLTQEYYNLFALLYADDVSIMADSIVNLQKLINVLGQFCSKWAMRVNIDKTKVMVFRRGGHLARSERWILNGEYIEVVSYYKYLGLLISSRNVWGKAVATLADQANKALSSLHIASKKIGGFSFKTHFMLFDRVVLPILLYGSEIWGFQYYEKL